MSKINDGKLTNYKQNVFIGLMCLPLALDLEKHVYEEDAESVMLS